MTKCLVIANAPRYLRYTIQRTLTATLQHHGKTHKDLRYFKDWEDDDDLRELRLIVTPEAEEHFDQWTQNKEYQDIVQRVHKQAPEIQIYIRVDPKPTEAQTHATP